METLGTNTNVTNQHSLPERIGRGPNESKLCFHLVFDPGKNEEICPVVKSIPFKTNRGKYKLFISQQFSGHETQGVSANRRPEIGRGALGSCALRMEKSGLNTTPQKIAGCDALHLACGVVRATLKWWTSFWCPCKCPGPPDLRG